MKINKYFLFLVSIILIQVYFFKGYSQTNVQITADQVVIPVVTLTDQEQIKFFLNEYLIIEDSVSRIDIIDATTNGFGEDDLLKVYPSNKIYFPAPSDTAQKVMNKWEFTPNFKLDAANESPEYFQSLTTRKAENAVFASLLRGLVYNFHALPIKIRFERDSTGVATFEMWGYNEGDLRYKPFPPQTPDSVSVYDVLHVWESDTLFLPKTQSNDFLYIYKTVMDTVFIKTSSNIK